MSSGIRASDITRPALRGASKKLIEVAWKYARMLGLETIPELVVRNHIAPRWLGKCHVQRWPDGTVRHFIEVQKQVMIDERTLDRVVAHEMAHYADHLLLVVEAERSGVTLREAQRSLHGPRWQRFADRINATMGADYVSVNSDMSYVRDTQTKPYLIVIVKFPNGRLGFAVGVRITERMKSRMGIYGRTLAARVISSVDSRWVSGPRIGTKFVTPMDPVRYEMLQALYERAIPIHQERA